LRPFLKFPGGKYRLVNQIRASLGEGKRLIEPFLGSGAVFLNTNYQKYLLADSNTDLINLYNLLHSDGEDFIEYCRTFFTLEYNNKDSYYAFRQIFNITDDTILKSALFVYLNRHCYNGLCRYNSKGGFNTPFGKHKNPLFPEVAMRFFIGHAKHAKFSATSFRETLKQAKAGDIVYCDPPYVPLSKTAFFTDYHVGGFKWEDQVQLAETANRLAGKGIQVVVSNHDTKEIRQLYKATKAKIERFQVRRSISCDGSNRAKVGELLAVFR